MIEKKEEFKGEETPPQLCCLYGTHDAVLATSKFYSNLMMQTLSVRLNK